MIPAGMTQLIFSLQFCAVRNLKSLILLANHEHTSGADFTDRTEISYILGRKITLLHNMSLLSVTYKFSHKNSPNEQNHLLCPKSPAHVLQIWTERLSFKFNLHQFAFKAIRYRQKQTCYLPAWSWIRPSVCSLGPYSEPCAKSFPIRTTRSAKNVYSE